MADDIKIKLGLDATELFAGLNKATAEAQKAISTIGNTKVDINEAPLVADLNKVETEAKQTGDALNKGLGGGLDGLKDKFGGLSSGSLDLGGSLQSLTGGVTSLVPGLGSLSGVLAGGGITAGIAAIGGGIAFAIEKGKAFETQLASLSSITGVSGPALDDLGEKAKVMASKFGTEATANIESFKTILSKLGPDIAKSPEALNSMAESVNTLSKATGDDPGKATEALTGALLQFGVSLDDPVKAADAMAVAMNVLAAGAKEGASEVPDVAAAINVAGVAASSAKVSFEETNSAIQILAAGGKVGAEAGTSLRNVLNKLGEGRFLPKDTAKELAAAGVDINKLGDTTISFSERLRELDKISGDAALKTKLFGTDAAAASILIKGANGSMDDLTKKLTGTNTAYDQAAINMNTFDESLNRIKSNVDNFAISFYDGMKMSFGMLAESIGPSVNELMGTMSDYFSRMWSVVGPILQFIGAQLMFGISNVLTLITESMNLFYETAVYAFDQVLGALKPLYDAIMSALGLDGAMGQGIDVVKMLQDAMNFASAAISAIFDVLQALGKILVDVVVFAFSKVISVITTVIETVAAVGRAIFDFVKSLPGVQTAISGLQSAFNAVYGFFSNLPGVINETQAYLKAIGFTFQAVFSALKQAFEDALNLDFTSAGAKLASVFDSKNWSAAFGAGLQQARSELKQTGEAAKKAGQEFKNFQDTTTVVPPPKGGGGGGGGGEKGGGGVTQTKSDFEKALAAYKEYLNQIELNRKEAIADFERQGLNKEEIQFKLASDPKLAPTADAIEKEIMDRFKATRDAEGNLQIGLVFGKGEDKDKALTEVRKLLLDAGKLEVDFKVKTPDFKDQIKEFENLAKDIEKTSATIIPVKVADTEDDLDQIKTSVTAYVDFIKIQNADIAQAQAEALAAGNVEQARAIGETIASNDRQIRVLQEKLDKYQKEARKEIGKNNIFNQISNALQVALLDQFNADRLKKERETNQKIRDEKLAALNSEETDLQKSLADRSISFEEYASKIAEIDANRAKTEEETNISALEKFKAASEQAFNTIGQQQSKILIDSANARRIKQTALDEAELAKKKKFEALKGQEGTQAFLDAQEAYNKAQKEAADNDAKLYGIRTSTLEDFAGNAIAQFGALAATGKATLADFGKAAAGAAFDAVAKMIPSFVTGILGSSITTLGPILGPLAAAALTGTLYGLLGLARSAAGFKDGVVDLAGPGTETSDSIPAWLSKGESVITASSTRANKEELAWMNANPGMSIRDYFTSHAPQVRYSVGEDGGLIREVQKLREETRGLGRQINRNTHVSISGELKADNNSIKAVIESERRRNARRG